MPNWHNPALVDTNSNSNSLHFPPMNISYLSDYNPETNPEFATRWANEWKKYHNESIELDDIMTTRNNRSGIINTQNQFERHLHNIMNHRSHQQEF